MADDLDILRQDAITKRVRNIGGNHILWSTKDVARIADYIATLPTELLFREMPTRSRKLADIGEVRRTFSTRGIVTRDATASDRNFAFIISAEVVDLAGDVIKVDGIDCSTFSKNPVVLNSHDSTALPIAASTSPVKAAGLMTATAKFPQPGVSEDSDQVAAAIRGGLLRAASIGFTPVRWSFAKDSSRPFGIDFHEIKLLEWSTCSVPCNSACLLLGATDSRSAADSDLMKMVNRRHEARTIAAEARSIASRITATPEPTRAQRIAEAASFRRAAGR